jgi:hypothetical protein
MAQQDFGREEMANMACATRRSGRALRAGQQDAASSASRHRPIGCRQPSRLRRAVQTVSKTAHAGRVAARTPAPSAGPVVAGDRPRSGPRFRLACACPSPTIWAGWPWAMPGYPEAGTWDPRVRQRPTVAKVDAIRLVAVADTHLSSRAPDGLANWAAVVRDVAATNPDLIVHLGDVTLDGIHHRGTARRPAAARPFGGAVAGGTRQP